MRVKIEGFQGFMKKICQLEKTDKTTLSGLLGYKTKAAIASYIRTALVLDLIKENEESILLTETGKEFCNAKMKQRKIVSQFLVSENGLGPLTNAIRYEGAVMSELEFQKCIRMFVDKDQDAKSLVRSLLEWYAFAGLLKKYNGRIYSMLASSDFVLKLDSLFASESLDHWLYEYLQTNDFGKTQSLSDLSYSNVQTAFKEFKECTSETAEEKMIAFLSKACRILGFMVQYSNGPRKQGKLLFGSKGDDFLVVLRSLNQDEAIEGVALACELKRSIANKKAVTQALAFADIVRETYPSFIVLPIVISDSDRYHDEIAIRYAEASKVIHLPLEVFMQYVDEQYKRYNKGETLLLPVDIVKIILDNIENREIEPRIPDLIAI